MTLDRRRMVWAKQIVYINVLDPSIVKGNNTQADYVIARFTEQKEVADSGRSAMDT